ncbi:MAG: hypothetical protein JXA71_05770 [Chitinispirillaceae bacterium]|nr:hypothetical protein [Chitinispirillaceae bacterium]
MISLSYGRAGEHGGVAIRIIFVVATLLVIGAFIGFFLHNYQQQVKENHRKASRISEYGIQVALERLSAEPSWTSGFPKTTCDGGWYTVALRMSPKEDTAIIYITAEGHIGNASDSRECVLGLTVNGDDSVWVQRSLH